MVSTVEYLSKEEAYSKRTLDLRCMKEPDRGLLSGRFVLFRLMISLSLPFLCLRTKTDCVSLSAFLLFLLCFVDPLPKACSISTGVPLQEFHCLCESGLHVNQYPINLVLNEVTLCICFLFFRVVLSIH